MALVFVSHASRDDGLASQLEAWLRANGFTDLFVDHSSIEGGGKWADALRASAGACRVVICLVTPNWLNSSQCPGEFRAAWYMGKRIIPLFLLGDEAALSATAADELRRVRAEDQGIDIALLVDEGRLDFARDEARTERLRKGLRAAGALAGIGLDPEAFEVDRKARPTPFPGLSSFGDDDADAALFFGRSREIAETLEELRAMRAASDRRPLVILGASGAGKSSLLKAGIIPRLRRETPAWIPLRAFRPGADPLLNFAEALTRTLADFKVTDAHGALRRSLLEAWKASARDNAGRVSEPGLASLIAALEAQGARLRAAAARPEATILICVDQAEEMARADGESGEALADYLRAAMTAQSQWRLAFTIRTDSFPELQSHRRFQGLEARGYDLRSLPVFRFSDVVEAPAKRYGVEIDPALVDQLMEDAPKGDALPLLAFAMQQLWEQFSPQSAVRAEDYRAMGGLSGLIEDAAERALCGVEPEQRDTALPAGGARKAQAELGARTFVPPLADVKDDGAAIRRVAAWKEFDEEQQALLDRFGRWRLVVRKAAESDGGTVEVAHEALFREWTRLKEWLKPERTRLEALRSLSVAAAAWARKNKGEEFLTHFGQRLKDAAALEKHPRYGPELDAGDRAYLAACRRSERKAAGRRRRLQALAAVAVLAVIGAGAAFAYQKELVPVWARYTKYWGKAPKPEALAALKPGQTFQDCAGGSKDCPVMVVLPAGEFLMGSPETEEDRSDDEGPQREISIQRFAVSETEVTFDDWAACVAGGGCGSQPSPGDSTWGRGRQPVINVSRDDAKEYATWLSTMTGAEYRLLTEAEWEYSARAGTTTPWSFDGHERKLGDYAWFNENSDRKAHPVRGKKANAFGLYDMHGNVFEWVEDCHADYDPAKDGAAVVTEPTDKNTTSGCYNRVIRGGSWGDYPRYLRSAGRLWVEPGYRGSGLGFRLARTLFMP